ncbi:MAG: hypothetical protein LBJ02_00680 [Bifidobacteriaceae bacterium]|jgi:hypothetical protein|nr:hypothetical protein [Bifidobacteriaceae bacterium]
MTPATARGRHLWLAIGLVAVFGATHAVLIYQSFAPDTTAGANDVWLYAWWVQQANVMGGWPGIDAQWVYPVGALAPMLLASVTGTGTSYLTTWCIMITLINLATAAVVLYQFGLTRAAGPLAGWFVFLMLLGPCGIARLDAVMMPLVLIALALAASRPALATVLLTCSAWIKVSGGAVLIALVAVLGSWRERFYRLLLPAALTCLAVFALQRMTGGQLRFLLSFVSAESDRGLQIEAVLATPVVLAHALRGEQLYWWNAELSTCETWGPGAELAIRVSDIAMPLMAVTVGILTWLARRHPQAALVTGSMALMSGLIVTHKVGSPQFVAWLAPAAVAALCLRNRLRFWLPVSAALLAASTLTGLLYPSGYLAFLNSSGLMLTVWVIRNALVVAVFVASLTELVRLSRSSPLGAVSSGHDSPGVDPSGDLPGAVPGGLPGAAPGRGAEWHPEPRPSNRSRSA